MGERPGRRRVSQVIGRNVYSLYRCDGTMLGRSDTLLQGADVISQRRLITYGGRHTAQQRGYFGTSLNKTENVVDEEQYVLTAYITEIFCHGQAGQAARSSDRKPVRSCR